MTDKEIDAMELVQKLQSRTTTDGGDIMHLSVQEAVDIVLDRDEIIRRDTINSISSFIDGMIDEIERDAFDAWHWNKEAGQYMGFLDRELCREIILRWFKKAEEEHIQLV